MGAGPLDGCGLVRVRKITLRLLDTYGDRDFLGLTGIEVLQGRTATPMRLDLSNLHASPRDLSALGHQGDPRTLDKVVDGANVTDDDRHMWLVPYTLGTDHLLSVDLGRPHDLVGLRVYNVSG